jgi:hypothetical protein
VMPPDVSYARSGDVAIAYQVVGSGPVDIVFVRGIAGDLLSTWDQPRLVRHDPIRLRHARVRHALGGGLLGFTA